MGIVSQEAIKQFQALMDQVMAVDEPLKRTFQVRIFYYLPTFVSPISFSAHTQTYNSSAMLMLPTFFL
ncbi:hypothetical protein Pyn_26706 [Prunus yedoensis var. nudiflora]|uniref:Uncharacterized protein n=1 Tax=Prunus yedoensis var. nudiflora TaxID=2094558 RepID=A0A314UFT5_PRUYE|nr:hypothetical protein Pyn_26706 [Prunus yedoensis var. nudiflora]